MQISSISNIALRIKSRAKSAVCILLSVVAILAPAVSMANTMLHLPSDLQTTESHPALSKESSPLENTMAGESCHDIDNQTQSHSQTDIETVNSAAQCCESYCDCSAFGCSAQLAIVGTAFGTQLISGLFYIHGTGHYASVTFSPLSPPPTI